MENIESTSTIPNGNPHCSIMGLYMIRGQKKPCIMPSLREKLDGNSIDQEKKHGCFSLSI